MSEKIRLLKLEMQEVYGKLCWMDYLLSKQNPITFHHIVEVRNGGKGVWENGALISLNAHEYLNYLDREYHRIYNELNDLFYDLNRTYLPPTEDYYKELNYVLKKVGGRK